MMAGCEAGQLPHCGLDAGLLGPPKFASAMPRLGDDNCALSIFGKFPPASHATRIQFRVSALANQFPLKFG